MPTALEVHSSRRDFFAGEDPGVAYRAGPGDPYPVRYHGENIVGYSKGGSQNFGPMAGANALVHWHNQGKGNKVHEILDAWGEYAKLDYLTREVYSCNIYIAFISMGVMTAACMAQRYGRVDLAKALWRHTRTGAILSALSAGWKPNRDRFNGYPVTMCGGRSFSGKIMYELTPNTFASSALDYYTGMSATPASSMEKAQQKYFKTLDIWGSNTTIRAVLKRVITNLYTRNDVDACVAWLREGPGFAANAAIIRTTNMVAFCTFDSVNTGSTNWLPAKAWYAGTAPESRWDIPRNNGVCTVDFPGRRWGGSISGHLLDDYMGYRAQRITVNKNREGVYQPFSWYDETKDRHVQGWAQLDFTGDIELDLRVGKGGVELIYPKGDAPPPPPPPPDKIDMLEVMAPSSVPFTTVTERGTGRIATIRDDANRIFVVVKGAHGTSWDWFYWDDNYIYHVITEGGEKGDPTAFKSHVAPGVKWCKRFATFGEVNVSSPVIYQWANCVQGPQHSLQAAKTTLHSRSYTAGELGMQSDDVPGSTVCYRLDWRWGPTTSNLETFTYAVGWGFLDWEYSEHPTLPNNWRSTKPIVEPDFPCFNVADWVDENMRPVDPPPGGGWHTIHADADLKFTNAAAAEALATIDEGNNHFSVSQVACGPTELAKVKAELTAIVGG